MTFMRVAAASAQFASVSAKREHDLNTNQTSFTAALCEAPERVSRPAPSPW